MAREKLAIYMAYPPTEFIGGVLPWVAEDPYPYDQTGWASDEPA